MSMNVSDYTDLAELLAAQHRPRDAREIRVAIFELHSRGLGDHAIASATGLDVAYVRRTLGSPRTSDAT